MKTSGRRAASGAEALRGSREVVRETSEHLRSVEEQQRKLNDDTRAASEKCEKLPKNCAQPRNCHVGPQKSREKLRNQHEIRRKE